MSIYQIDDEHVVESHVSQWMLAPSQTHFYCAATYSNGQRCDQQIATAAVCWPEPNIHRYVFALPAADRP